MCRARRALGSLEDAVEGDEHPQRAKRTTGERFFGDDRSVRVMVTGGAGFIGSNIVRRLHELGHEPVVLDDISSGFRENLVPGVAFTEGDVQSRESVETAMEGCGVVLHLAARVGNARSIFDPQTDSAINVIGTLNVLETARTHGIDRVVFSSSAGILGELKSLPIAEDHPQDPDSPYGTSKLAAEKMCLVDNKLYGKTTLEVYADVVAGHGEAKP